MREAQTAARSLAQQIRIVEAGSEIQIDAAFDRLNQQRVGAVIVDSGAFFLGLRDRLAALAARGAIPAIYDQRDYVVAGGLMSYGTRFADSACRGRPAAPLACFTCDDSSRTSQLVNETTKIRKICVAH